MSFTNIFLSIDMKYINKISKYIVNMCKKKEKKEKDLR